MIKTQTNGAHKKKILILGDYADFYIRNRVIIDVLKDEFEVRELSQWKKSHKRLSFLCGILRHGPASDYILVLKEGQRFAFILFLYKIFFPWKKIIFDAFISYYDTYVFDRKIVKQRSLKAFYNYLLDYFSFKSADYLIYDTNEHRKYFEKTFRIKNKKSIILPVVIDPGMFDRIPEKEREDKYKNKFVVLFYGSYIPLQGVEYIIKAADILKKEKGIQFILIGSGQTRPIIDKIYSQNPSGNVEFIGKVEYEELIAYIKMCDLCLGIFGDSDKARRVIANKVLDSMAARKILITAKNPALEEYFEDKKDLVYCKEADARDLAEKILYVRDNYENLRHIGDNARGKVDEYFSKKNVVNIIKKELL